MSRSLLQATANPHSWTLLGKSGSISCGVTAHFSWVLVGTRFSLCPPRFCFPVLCKLWWLYGGVNGDLLQEGLCHTRVCCTQNPFPCRRPPLTHMYAGDTQTLKGRPGQSVGSPGMHKVLFEPSEHLCWLLSLILNMISPLLPSFWGFSFAPGHEVSFLVGSNIPLSTVVQQRVVILEFLQEKMSARPASPPSCYRLCLI